MLHNSERRTYHKVIVLKLHYTQEARNYFATIDVRLSSQSVDYHLTGSTHVWCKNWNTPFMLLIQCLLKYPNQPVNLITEKNLSGDNMHHPFAWNIDFSFNNRHEPVVSKKLFWLRFTYIFIVISWHKPVVSYYWSNVFRSLCLL